MIDIQGVHKRYATPLPFRQWRPGRRAGPPVLAVRGLDFHAADGAITGLLGANGAGKTSTLRMLAGLAVPDAGRITIDGIDVVAQPLAAVARLGLLSDDRGLSHRLTARENIVYHGELHGLTRPEAQHRAETLATLLDMHRLLDRRTDGFSQGERMKTALARALVHDPPNIVLDEPTNGLDVPATRALRETLRHLRTPAGGGKCIVVSTHIMQEVERLCDAVVVVANGRDVAAGSVDALLRQTEQRYFEDAFVVLAYGGSNGHSHGDGNGHGDSNRSGNGNGNGSASASASASASGAVAAARRGGDRQAGAALPPSKDPAA